MIDFGFLLKEKGMTQVEFAKLISVEKSTLNNYVKGRREPELKTLCRMAEVLDVSADYLLGLPDRSGPHLAEDEKALLDGFRALSAEGKEYVLHSLSLASLAHSGKNGAVPDVEAVE